MPNPYHRPAGAPNSSGGEFTSKQLGVIEDSAREAAGVLPRGVHEVQVSDDRRQQELLQELNDMYERGFEGEGDPEGLAEMIAAAQDVDKRILYYTDSSERLLAVLSFEATNGRFYINNVGSLVAGPGRTLINEVIKRANERGLPVLLTPRPEAERYWARMGFFQDPGGAGYWERPPG